MIKVVNYIDNENSLIYIKVYDIDDNIADDNTVSVNTINNGVVAVKKISASKWNNRRLVREEIRKDRY